MKPVTVLASGGLDSCVLIADLARSATVHPLYIKFGLAWESQERYALKRFLDALPSGTAVEPLSVMEMPVASVYGHHWSVTGENIPDTRAPDIEVELPGRNLMLLAGAALWSSMRGVNALALGSLEGNPFSDASPEFFRQYAECLSTGLAPHRIEILTPYRHRTKTELISTFPDLPHELSLTCMAPRTDAKGLLHCGACNKCAERRHAFVAARLHDSTRYAGTAG
ncbi:7-cyano-7-deazaguanine synthase [Streptomyces sp. NPDC048191]|uniref:7-cyano-7-deazaguanine synthase n=1 Tax=Streptomyces sp. NPDC048191 TaxID=3155484 RepID=UPI0033BFC7BA